MINDWGMPTLRVFDSGDKLNNGDVASCGGVMKGTGSTFISLTQDLWALLHQVLQESQVTPLSQLGGQYTKWNNRKRVEVIREEDVRDVDFSICLSLMSLQESGINSSYRQ